MGCPRDAARELLQEQRASRAPKARCCCVLCSRSAAAIRTASTVAESYRKSTLEARFGRALGTGALCVRESRAGAHSGGAWRFRIAPQLIALSRTIDHVARVGSAVALASVCGAITACHDRVRVVVCAAPCGGVPGGAHPEFPSSSQSFPDHSRHCFEVRATPANFCYEWF